MIIFETKFNLHYTLLGILPFKIFGNSMKHRILILVLMVTFASCRQPHRVEYLIKAEKVYTVDNEFCITNAIVVDKGKIVATGNFETLKKQYKPDSILDYSNKYIYPGLIDAHCHFFGYGEMLENQWLGGARSWKEVVEQLKKNYQHHPTNWILGRGWDQNQWDEKSMPDRELLDQYFPDVPVYLVRVDGHCAVVNSKALQMANVTENTKINGGKIELRDGKPSGLLFDNAKEYMRSFVPKPSDADLERQLLRAQADCYGVGLTSVTDAGLPFRKIRLLDSLQRSGKINIHVNAMLEPEPENLHWILEGKERFNPKLTVKFIKLYADGALGSRGALLFEPYSDAPNHTGILVTSEDSLRVVCRLAVENQFSVATHCIGDRAVNIILNIYSEFLKPGNDLRWRIEHAQVVQTADFRRFGDFAVIPSIQPTHAISDMQWAERRLGNRVSNAYAYQQLLQQNGWLAAGSDFPIESINPLEGFCAAVFRKNREGRPENGFQPENALSRKEALYAMTVWAAKAGFDEANRGSLEVGKVADWVVLNVDLLQASQIEILNSKVFATYVDGQRVFGE